MKGLDVVVCPLCFITKDEKVEDNRSRRVAVRYRLCECCREKAKEMLDETG